MTPDALLRAAYLAAEAQLHTPFIDQPIVAERIALICQNTQNRAVVRFLLACALAKVHRPEIDIRKPYTRIGDPDRYSGRRYDEAYIQPFIFRHRLPCNATTAFLTPAFRNRNQVLTSEVDLVGRPAEVYSAALDVLNDIQTGKVSASHVLHEAIRLLIRTRNLDDERIAHYLAAQQAARPDIPLASEAIITLIQQHLLTKGASRLPVLVVAAAYQVVSPQLGETVLALMPHNAADQRTGAFGDLQITLMNDDRVVTVYEMKFRRMSVHDIEVSVHKLKARPERPDNYIFITTEWIEEAVRTYCAGLYEATGVEFVVLDCLSFLRHFLHFFHRSRIQYLNAYQALLLAEPPSAVGQAVKEAFLALRQAAEQTE
jgi:DNA adenine methylase